MRKRLLALLLCVVMVLGLFAAPASAASSEEEALGEIDIYSGGTKMSYLSINGRNRELVYTYYNYVDSTGQTKQIPAYCVNPDIEGVPQTVAPGESIKYMADEIGTDPKAVGIVAHGYPTRSLEELHLENAEQAYYATKMALWCYLLSNWDINDLKVNSSLSGVELQRAQKILAAAKDIYVRGTRWNEVPQPRVTCLPDRDTAYEVTIDGKTYKQQIFTFWSETWICNYRVDVAFALPDEVPEGTRIVDLSNRDITFITTEDTGNGFAGKFKVLYPADQVEGKTGSVRLSFRTDVYKYGIFYATCMETDEYGQLQDYLVDTDPTTEMRLSAYSNYEDGGTVINNRTKLKILKLETGTKLPLSGALFEVVDPEGATVGVFATDDDGEIELPLTLEGNYTVIERAAPPDHLLSEEPAQNVKVEYGETATLTFYNAPYGNLEVRKVSDTGDPLPGVLIQIKHIESGVTYTQETDPSGVAFFSELQPGGYEVRELAGILNSKEYHVQLFPGKSATLIVENQKRPNLTVYKYDADTGAPVADTVFLVTAADGHSVDEIRTDASGKAELKDLLPGVYEVSEKSVPSPYLKDAPDQLVTLYPNRDRTIYFENHKKPNLTVNKVDSITGAPIQGTKFQVWYASNNTTSGELNDLGIFYSDENGQFTINAIRDGWYKVTELEPAAGYSIKEPATQEIYIKGGESKELTFENIPLSALVVWKYDSVNGAAVEGAVFQVKYLGGTSGTGGTVIGTYKTGPSGSFTVTGLEAGTYIVEELASDSGHVIDTAPQTAYLSGKEQDVVQLYFGNSPKGALLVKKVDASNGKPISDVEFLVTTSDGTVVGDANGRYVTDSAGTFLVEGIDPGTTLVVKETRAKDGYLLDDTPQTAMIKAGQTVPLEFRNQPMGNLIINKLDSVTRKPLEGVEFQLTYADGSYVDAEGGTLSSKGLYYTDENGQIILSGLTGTIVATETKTIEGYTIHEETRSQTVVINPNDIGRHLVRA